MTGPSCEQYGLGMDLVGHGAFRPTHLGIVAQNHHYLGDADPALRSLDEALERTLTSGELVHQPDLLRLPGRDHDGGLPRPDGRSGQGPGRRR